MKLRACSSHGQPFGQFSGYLSAVVQDLSHNCCFGAWLPDAGTSWKGQSSPLTDPASESARDRHSQQPGRVAIGSWSGTCLVTSARIRSLLFDGVVQRVKTA